jgi:hypothetical protein
VNYTFAKLLLYVAMGAMGAFFLVRGVENLRSRGQSRPLGIFRIVLAILLLSGPPAVQYFRKFFS